MLDNDCVHGMRYNRTWLVAFAVFGGMIFRSHSSRARPQIFAALASIERRHFDGVVRSDRSVFAAETARKHLLTCRCDTNWHLNGNNRPRGR